MPRIYNTYLYPSLLLTCIHLFHAGADASLSVAATHYSCAIFGEPLYPLESPLLASASQSPPVDCFSSSDALVARAKQALPGLEDTQALLVVLLVELQLHYTSLR